VATFLTSSLAAARLTVGNFALETRHFQSVPASSGRGHETSA